MIGLEHETDVLAPEAWPGPPVRRPWWTGRPTRTVPLVGVRMQPRMESRVVLPLPTAPSEASIAACDGEAHALERLHPAGAAAENFTTSAASSIASVIA